MEILFITIILFLALYFAVKVFFKPFLAFSIILGLGIIFQDLKLTELQIENKLILLAVVVSLFFASKKIGPHFKFQLSQNKLNETIFLLLIFYLIAQSIRGVFEYWRGITAFYWIAQFIVIGYIGAQKFAGRYIFYNALLRADKTRSYITYSMGAYTAVNFFLSILSADIFEKINITNPSLTALFFPVTLVFPIIILSIKYGAQWEKICALVSWVLAFACIIIASSRGALIPFVFMTFIGIFYIYEKRNIIKFLGVALLVLSFLFIFSDTVFFETGIQTWLDSLQVTEIFFKTDFSEVRDLDRLIHVQAAWNVINDNWLYLLFGYGYRVSGIALAPELEFLYAIYLPNLNFANELGNVSDVATFGISSMMVDFGLVGVFGFASLFLVIAIKILNSTRGLWRVILFVNLMFFILRLYGNNFLTYPLFYFALAPCGVFMCMINYHRVIGQVQERSINIVVNK